MLLWENLESIGKSLKNKFCLKIIEQSYHFDIDLGQAGGRLLCVFRTCTFRGFRTRRTFPYIPCILYAPYIPYIPYILCHYVRLYDIIEYHIISSIV